VTNGKTPDGQSALKKVEPGQPWRMSRPPHSRTSRLSAEGNGHGGGLRRRCSRGHRGAAGCQLGRERSCGVTTVTALGLSRLMLPTHHAPKRISEITRSSQRSSRLSSFDRICEASHEYALMPTPAIRHSLNNPSRVAGLGVVAGQGRCRGSRPTQGWRRTSSNEENWFVLLRAVCLPSTASLPKVIAGITR